MAFRDHLPITRDWLNRLESQGATDSFQGKLGRYGSVITNPFWARTLNDVLPTNIKDSVSKVVPVVKRQRLGGKHQSTKLERSKYYTSAWSTFPCQCKYRYAGAYSASVGCIGHPSGPPLRSDALQAPHNNYHRLVSIRGQGAGFKIYGFKFQGERSCGR
jgi:hypothetical protein